MWSNIERYKIDENKGSWIELNWLKVWIYGYRRIYDFLGFVLVLFYVLFVFFEVDVWVNFMDCLYVYFMNFLVDLYMIVGGIVVRKNVC